MNFTQEQIAAVIDPTKHVNFDQNTLSDLLTDELREVMIGRILSRAWNTMIRANRDKYAMTYDMEGIRLIEEQLNAFVKPRIANWQLDDRTPVIKRVAYRGVKTSRPEHIKDVYADLHAYGMLYGQCLAQMYGWKWIARDRALMLVDGDTLLNPCFKPLKFVTFGVEDSLVAFARINDPRFAVNRAKIAEMVDEALKQQGSEKTGAKSQYWYDDSGLVQEVVVTPKDGRVIHIKNVYTERMPGAGHAN